MKIITKEQAVRFYSGGEKTAGVYALVDPRDGAPRYVGSTSRAEYRLYNHMSGCGRKRTPKDRWLHELKNEGLWPEMWLLEEGDFGFTGSEERHEAEARWIEICQELFAGGDLNSRLAPSGHVNLKSKNKLSVSAEIRTLRAKVKELEDELAFWRGLDAATLQHDLQRCTVLHVAQLQKLQRNATLAYRQRCTLQ